MKNWFILVLLSLLYVFSSCNTQRLDHTEKQQDVLSTQLKQTLSQTTSLKGNPIFLNYEGQTKSEASEVPFIDLLDTLSLSSIEERGYLVTQIPFKATFDYNEIIISDSLNIDENSWSLCRKFFVTLEEKSSGKTKVEIVTMIPSPRVLETFGPHSFDYINREYFDGFIIHSDLEGNQSFVTYSSHGPVQKGELIYNSDCNDANKWIIIPGIVQTKSSDEELEPAICIAYRNLQDTDNRGAYPIFFDQGNPADDPNKGGRHLPENGGGSGGGGGSESPQDPFLYNITVDITGNGEVSGTGTYSKNYNATIKARGLAGSHFVRWAGEFYGRDTCFVYKVTKDVFSTALFQQETSCYDSETTINAVINSQNLAATCFSNAEKGIYTGADYGWTRFAGTKYHRGVDIAATEGTPIFAPYDGVITKIVSDIENGEYKKETSNYSQSSWNAGNRIWLKCHINGNDITFKYFHLRSPAHGGGVANGLSVGSKVIGGQLIGYTGQTGNAQGVDIKHLHLETWMNGHDVNPWSYINGEKDIKNGLIINTNCDQAFSTNPDDDFVQLSYQLPYYFNNENNK